MELTEEILNFIRDAEYKIGQLTTEMLNMSDDEDEEYTELNYIRENLINFSDMVYNTRYSFRDGVDNRFMDWSNHEILAEIDYIRKYADLNPVPYISFGNRSTIVISKTTESSSPGQNNTIPIGSEGDLLTFDANGNLILTELSDVAGWDGVESISDYFNG